jgi:glycosyltransferase involved in cell wall biosynthesis
VGAIKTIVIHQETGLIVQPGNFEQLLEALDVMVSNKALASRLGQSARQIVEERYSAGSTLGKYLSLFESALLPG